MSVSQAQLAAGRGPEAAHTTTSSRPGAGPLEHGNVNLSWLVQLHWAAVLGQVVILAAAWAWSAVELPLAKLGAVLVVEVLGNLAVDLWSRRRRVSDAGIAAVMLADVVVLTLLLDLTGGVSNPFAAIYLVFVALAAVVLPSRWAWALAVASMGGFAYLYVNERIYGRWHHITLRLQDDALAEEYARIVWLGFSFASVLIVFFIRRISAALDRRERELEEIRSRALRRERLASLATLAAGAAHELATPLSTIAVVAKEMQRSLPADASGEVKGDLQIVRDQVARCREILDRMSARAGETAGEPLSDLTVRAWIDAALDGAPGRERVALEVGPGVLDATVRGPARALADMLRGLVKNAVQASAEGLAITLRVVRDGALVRVSVSDRGRGMSPEVLSRVGEPFYTTKGPGEGMGLGLFLTRVLAEQLGGDFRIASNPGEGTEATLELPAVSG